MVNALLDYSEPSVDRIVVYELVFEIELVDSSAHLFVVLEGRVRFLVLPLADLYVQALEVFEDGVLVVLFQRQRAPFSLILPL